MTLKVQESQTQTIFIALLGSFILLFVLMAWLLFPTQSSKTVPITPIVTSTEKDNAVEGRFCGGIAGILCSEGYECKLDGNYPDAGGKCLKN
ncbi:MAG: hypothetical protein WC596_02895 [Candidatus Shapirobacteria bacterium]